jgi:hypothetical protein
MSFVNQQLPVERDAKAGSVMRRIPRRIAHLAVVLFITVASYAVQEARPETNAAPSRPITMKLADPSGDLALCTASISMQRAQDFDPAHPKFRLDITDSFCLGSGIASVTGGGFIEFPNNGLCVQIPGTWTTSLQWRNALGATIGHSDMGGEVLLIYTGATGVVTTVFEGSVTDGMFAGATAAATQNSVGTGLTCLVVGDINGANLFGAGGLAGL